MLLKRKYDNENLKGSISYLMLPTPEARQTKFKEVFFNVSGDAEVVIEDKLQLAERYLKMARDHVKEVDIEIVAEGDAQGVKISSIDQLYLIEEGAEAVNEIINTVLGGLKLGKSLPST